jgi:hypothetical protein
MPSKENFEKKDVEGAVASDQEIPETADAASAADSARALATIRHMISDPAIPAKDISRLILVEMTKIIQRMVPPDNVLERGVSTRKHLIRQFRTYRLLHTMVFATREPSNEDNLNIDGEKFKSSFARVRDWIREAAGATGFDQALTHRFMLTFDDIVKADYETMRSEIEKIGKPTDENVAVKS